MSTEAVFIDVEGFLGGVDEFRRAFATPVHARHPVQVSLGSPTATADRVTLLTLLSSLPGSTASQLELGARAAELTARNSVIADRLSTNTTADGGVDEVV